VNGLSKVRLTGWPTTKNLYGFLDLLGSAQGVSLNVGAVPPDMSLVGGVPGSVLAQLQTLTAFEPRSISQNVKIAENDLRIEHIHEKADQQVFGVAFGNAPVQRFFGEPYFEVTIEKVRAGVETGGIVLGLTRSPWDARWDANAKFEKGEQVTDGWSIGYSGQAKTPDKGFEKSDWNPNTLRKGDKVGLLICLCGYGRVYVNGQPRVRLEGWPTQGVFYPFVDLVGSTQAVSLNVNATPPLFPLANALTETFFV
jgi:hypothetical protein